MPDVVEYSVQSTFDHTLSGPFDNLFHTRLSASRALCKGIIAVISASTVCIVKFEVIISPIAMIVNRQYKNKARPKPSRL